MATKKYLVTLTPHNKFFFGGEKTLGTDNQNYLVESRYFPQQTSVLGFIRYQLLVQSNDDKIFKNNKIQDDGKAKKLIGKSGFTIGNTTGYGKIKSLSPVFIVDKNAGNNGDKFYFPGNKEYQTQKKYEDNCILKEENVFVEPVKINNNQKQLETGKPLIKLEKYDPKFDLYDFLLNKKGDRKTYDEIFTEHKQVGIRKNYEGKTDEKAYFVQTYRKMKNGYAFGFIVELDDFDLKSKEVVIFGGEQQAFKMEVTEFDDDLENFFPNYKPSKNFNKIVLVSDTYVEKDVIDQFDFAITETADFRFMETKTGGHNYHQVNKSKKYNLYKKGSVFYFDGDKNNLITSTFNKDDFKNIGYNHYKIINKNNQ